jgi:hypothetical protein
MAREIGQEVLKDHKRIRKLRIPSILYEKIRYLAQQNRIGISREVCWIIEKQIQELSVAVVDEQ